MPKLNWISARKTMLLVSLLLCVVFSGAAQAKAALVIGNGNYRGLSKLNNPVNDARDMADSLRGLGFTVDLLTDAGLPEMEQGVVRLGSRLSGSADAVGFFFYAGHGVQSGGINYLIPADAQIAGEAFLKTKALAVQALLDTLQGTGNKLNVIVLDACRDNPYSWARSGTRGLTVIGSQPPGSIIAFATSAGSVARDGGGRNGVFTSELLKNIKTPGLDIYDVFRRTGAAVRNSTGGAQVPAVYSQLFDPYYLAGAPSAGERPAAQPAPQPASRPAPAGMVWVEGGTFQMGDTFGDGYTDEKPVHSVTVSGFYLGKYEVTFEEYDAFCADTGRSRPSDSGWGRGRRPVMNVSWYDAVEYCNWLSRKEGLRPVYSGSGSSISCDWNSDGYRLPTEAEWEYAAKGGTRSSGYKYSGGNEAGTVGWYSGNSGNRTQPVGGKQDNELGLYDLSGNVWEWCWDWKGSYSASSQTDPRGPSSGDGRVNRGGCWYGGAGDLRSAFRNSNSPGDWGSRLGFRLARPRVR